MNSMINTLNKVISTENKTTFVAILAASVLSLFALVNTTVAIEPELTVPATEAEAAAIVAEVAGAENKEIISTILEQEAESYVEEQLRQVEDDPVAYLYYKGKQEGLADSEIHAMQGIMYCESKYNPYAANPSSTARGLFQFLDTSWSAWGNGGDVYSIPDNIDAAITYYQYAGTRPWVCPPVYVTPYQPGA